LINSIVKTKYSYHDALITEIAWTEAGDLMMTAQLILQWNDGCERSTLRFSSVCNISNVKAAINAIEPLPALHGIAEIVGIVRTRPKEYCVETGHGGPLEICCDSVLEL
jgi:hypothetical protein